MHAIILNLCTLLDGLEESPYIEEVCQVLLSHIADLTHELQAAAIVVRGVIKRQRVFAKCLEEFRIEGCVLLPQVVIEVEVPIHAKPTIHVPEIERHATSEFVHDGSQRRAARCIEPIKVANEVREDVVRRLGAPLHVDSPLVVVAAFVTCAPVVHVGIQSIEAILDAVNAVIARPVRRGISIACILWLTLNSEVRVVVVEGIDCFAARQIPRIACLLAGCHSLGHTHQILLPYSNAVEPADALVDGVGEDGLEGSRLEVEEGMFAANSEATKRRSIAKGFVLGIAVTADVVVAIHLAALDMYLDVGPFAKGLGHALRVGYIYNIVEGVLRAVDDVEAFRQFGSRLGIRDKLVIHAASQVERCTARHIIIYEDIYFVAIVLGIDACRVAHIGAAAAHHLVVPVVGVAIGLVVVDAEILLIVCPRLVLHLDGNADHKIRHADSSEGCRQFLVAHRLVFGLQLGAGSILEEVAAQHPHHFVGVELHGISIL